MALFKGSIVNEISGKLGGNVFAHNAGGQIIRQYRVPTNPNTVAQIQRRTAFGNASIAWRSTLTASQRAAWNAIAGTITATNRLGDAITLNGQQAYVRAATLATLAGLAAPAAAPSVTGETSLGAVSLTAELVGGDTEVLFDFGETPPWAGNDNGRLLVFVSGNVSPAVNFYRGPFLFAGTIDGVTATPITSGDVDWASATPSPGPSVSGLKRFVRVVAYLGGQVSQQSQLASIAS